MTALHDPAPRAPELTRPSTWRDAIEGQLERVLARFRPPRRIAPTKAGWFAFGAPLILGMAAINAGNNLLFILLGATLGAIVLSGILSERALRGVAASVRPLGDAWAGEEARLTVQVRRTLFEPGDGAAFGLRIRERLSRRERRVTPPLDVILPIIEGRVGEAVATRSFTRRGRIELGPCEAVTRYPFALLAKSRDLDAECAVIVRPRRVDVPDALASPLGSVLGGDAAAHRGLGQDIYGLREWQERDPIHRLHALRSLSLGKDVMVETEALHRPTAWLGVANVFGADPHAFERTLEVAAATLLAWDADGYAVGLRTVGRRWTPGSATVSELLDALATLELEDPIADDDTVAPLWLVPYGAAAPRRDGALARVDTDGTVTVTEGAR